MSTVAPREQILEASAQLFAGEGFAATSTRDIAEMVGIRQASLYYHFTGKDGILNELLQMSVRPSLDKVDRIEAECPAEVPEAVLYLLALVDVDTLARAPHNIGKLYRLPDVMANEVYDQSRSMLKELAKTYGRLGRMIVSEPVAATTSIDQLGGMLTQLVETVIRSRADADRDKIRHAEAHAFAASCLRICGVPQDRIDLAEATASILLPAFIDEHSTQ